MINIPARLLSCEPHSLHILGCQLADFPSVRAAQAFYPSLNLRLSFAQPSLKVR